VFADGTLHLVAPSVADELLGYLPSSGQLVLGASTGAADELRFVDPANPAGHIPPVIGRDAYGGAAGAVTDDGAGGFFYTSTRGRHVLRVYGAGITDVYAGIDPMAGDGGPAPRAELRGVSTLAFDTGGSLYVYEQDNAGVWRIDPSGALGVTLAGPPAGFYPYLHSLSSGAGGPLLDGGPSLDGARGLRDLTGHCLLFCGDPAAAPFAATATFSADPVAGLADATPGGSSLDAAVAFDGATAYVYVGETVPAAGVRTYIKRVTATGLDEIAGSSAAPVDTTESAGPLKIVGGTTLAGHPAGWPALGQLSFQAGAGRVFVLQSDAADGSPWNPPYSLWSGAPGGTWRRDVADVRSFAVDSARGRLYYVSPDDEGKLRRLWRKTLGTLDDEVVLDLDETGLSIKPLAVLPDGTGLPVVYLILGSYDMPTSIPANTLYRFIDTTL
jgi:hypothetical protein